MSRFEVTTCDSCGDSARVVFWGLNDPRRLDLCPQCAAYVAGFIEEGCERDYKRDVKRVEQ